MTLKLSRAAAESLGFAIAIAHAVPLLEVPRSWAGANAACASLLGDIALYASQFRGAIGQAVDSARRAGVYPGTLRDMRRRYRLHWSGWDR